MMNTAIRKLRFGAFVVLVLSLAWGSSRTARGGSGDVGRYQIAVVHSNPTADSGAFGDTVYRVDTISGEVCKMGVVATSPAIRVCK